MPRPRHLKKAWEVRPELEVPVRSEQGGQAGDLPSKRFTGNRKSKAEAGTHHNGLDGKYFRFGGFK